MIDMLLPTLTLPEETPHHYNHGGYKLRRDAPLTGTPTLVLESVFEQCEGQITWTEMMRRCEAEGPHAGQWHAEKLLLCQSVIPEEWEKYHLYFMGTEWQCLGKDQFGQPQDLRLLPYLIYCDHNSYHHWFDSPPYDSAKAGWKLWFKGMTCGQEQLFSHTDRIVLIAAR